MTTVATTSADVYAAFGASTRKNQIDAVFDIVAGACRNGTPDMSLREIAHTYHRVHGKPIDVGTVSGRVTALVMSNRLVRVQGAERPCSITGKTVHPVTAPARQASVF